MSNLNNRLNPETRELIVRFSVALRDKLLAAQKKYGYTDGWSNPGWMEECRADLIKHVGKGDPVDVAAYCAFLWHHGESTASEAWKQGERVALDAFDQAAVARAFQIADEAMFERLESECVPSDEYRTVLGLTDEGQQEVKTLAEASSAIQEAYEWLHPRGYVEVGEDKDGEFINVVRRPGEDT